MLTTLKTKFANSKFEISDIVYQVQASIWILLFTGSHHITEEVVSEVDIMMCKTIRNDN